MAKNLYESLGVSKTASQDEIKKAFRKLAIKHHPDKVAKDADAATQKHNEDKFKEMNEAYTVLMDEEKRRQYDAYGTYDNNAQQPDMSSMFADMFGGGTPDMGFFSMGGHPDQTFKMFFGGGGQHTGPQQPSQDVIEVKVSMTEIFKGVTKKVEFDIVDRCSGCQGTGAKGPGDVITCLTCHGQGSVPQQVGPFMINQNCPSCNGRGQVVKQHRQCAVCNGERARFVKRSFDIRIPQGVPHKHMHRMEAKGSFDIRKNCYNDMVLVFSHDIPEQYTIDYSRNNVHMTIDVKLEELLCGFVKEVDIYGEPLNLHSKGYFDPSKDIVVRNKGFPYYKRKDHGDLVIKCNILFPEREEKFSKYHSIFMTMFKVAAVEAPPDAVCVN
jgi:molecular chaperone DnaJ